MNVKISYGITTHNEPAEYFTALFGTLLKYKREEDEIIILDDESDNPDTIAELNKLRSVVKIETKKFNYDFAAHKNYLNSLCKGTHIFQIDADESLHKDFIRVLPEIVFMNPTVDLYYFPRINVVPGLTQDDINKWRWAVNEQGFINYPDWQGRLYKNNPNIVWTGKVHERITGQKEHCYLPKDEVYSILHIKTIDRQRLQNELYNTLQ